VAARTPGLLQALNPAIYLISLLPGIGVQVLDGDNDATFRLLPATLAVVLLQHAINLLNDVSDWRLGADTEKYDSWVRFHHQDTRTAAMHGWISFLLGGLLGMAVLLITDRLWILAVASPMLVLGYLYNSGPRPLSYTHLGEWVTGLCYGPGVFGCLWLLVGGNPDLRAVLGMTAFAALAMGLLLSHQPPQIETDRRSGKRSFAVRYGAARTRQAARLLFTLFLASYGTALWLSDNSHVTVATYSVTALLAGIGIMLVPPKPVVILMPAALLMLLTLLAASISSLPTH
jgi:1,4-dihydroxy-2-naphthoate octaprenyltransferase